MSMLRLRGFRAPNVSQRPARSLGTALFALASLLIALASVAPAAEKAAENAAAIEKRISRDTEYLASDELEGRGVGSEGLEQAADYIAEEFRKLGLKTDLYDGTPFQTFEMVTGAKLGQKNSVTLAGPDGKKLELKLGEQFTPLALGGSGKLDHPLVFAGYGITAEDIGYDDYEGIDVQDKAVVVVRKEPQQNNPHSQFNGTNVTRHAYYATKISNAYQQGAAAVIFVTDEVEIERNLQQRREQWQEAVKKLVDAHREFTNIEEPTAEQVEKHRLLVDKLTDQIQKRSKAIASAEDPLLGFKDARGDSEGREMPVLHVQRSVVNQMLRSVADTDLAAIEEKIDEKLEPNSVELAGWKISGETEVERTEVEVQNVVAVLEPKDGKLAEETIVIGAHYDHLGKGEFGSLAPNRRGEIHNGADDNASGTAALLEVARQITERGGALSRRVVFIAFTAEERGLIGSARYVRSPLYPLEQTVAMLNMDMVGRLEDDKLIVHGTGTAKVLEELVDKLGESYAFKLTKKASGFGPSDHSSFYSKEVPVLHFFTGTHKDYHRPSDDFEKVNVAGIRRVAGMVADVAVELAEAPERPVYIATKSSSRARRGGDRPYFGSIPDFANDAKGYAISGAAKESPAAKAGVKAGDVIVKFGDAKVANLSDFDLALRKNKAGEKVPFVVLRDGKEVKLEVKLGEPR